MSRSPKTKSPSLPKWDFPPIKIEPTPIKKSPKRRKLVKSSPKSPNFDFDANFIYANAQMKTPLKPYEEILSPRTYKNFVNAIYGSPKSKSKSQKNQIQTKRKLEYFQEQDDESIEPTQILED